MDVKNQKSKEKNLALAIAAILLLGFYLGYSDGRRDSGNQVVSISEVNQ